MWKGNGVRLVGFVSAVVVTLAACGDDGGDGDAAAGDEEAPEQETAPTIDDLLALGRPLNIAHAGGDGEWPHSTLFAYGQAVEAGADMLELDIRLSADGVVMVHHDDTVDRITEAEGAVADYTAAELQELDAAYSFEAGEWDARDAADADYPYRGVRTGEVDPPEGYTADDFVIPTLRDVAERFPQMPLDIEIKGAGEAGAEAAEALAAELADLDREDSAVVVSFDQATVDHFADAAPDVDVSPGTEDMLAWYTGEGELDEYRIVQVPTVYEGVDVMTPDNIARFEAEDPPVDAWVFMDSMETETEENYQELIDLGVNGIITARPSQFP
jgi:glycerophosphoryl diester phosphodiesterase